MPEKDLPPVDACFLARTGEGLEGLFRRISEEAPDFGGAVGPCIRATRLAIDRFDQLVCGPGEWVRVPDVGDVVSESEARARIMEAMAVADLLAGEDA